MPTTFQVATSTGREILGLGSRLLSSFSPFIIFLVVLIAVPFVLEFLIGTIGDLIEARRERREVAAATELLESLGFVVKEKPEPFLSPEVGAAEKILRKAGYVAVPPK